MLAALVKVPELEIDSADAKRIAQAWNNVQTEYSFAALDPKTTAWTNLIFACGAVYGPRIMAAKIRRAMEKQSGDTVTVSPAPATSSPASPAPTKAAARSTMIGGVDLNALKVPGFAS